MLQAADIVIYDADFVPVGEDQVPHVELTRETVRRFNHQFGLRISEKLNTPENQEARLEINGIIHTGAFVDAPVMIDQAWLAWTGQLKKIVREIGFENAVEELPHKLGRFYKMDRVLAEPGHLLTETPRLPGTDGRRMAKSYGNAIWLSDPPQEIREKARNMMTDPQRVRRTDPGRPEVCPVFAFHKLFSLPETIAKVDTDCRTAAIGCVDCKKLMAENLVTWIEPIQTRRREFEAHPQQVWDILDGGSKKAHAAAKKTMKRVRNAIFRWDEARKPGGLAAGRAGKAGAGN